MPTYSMLKKGSAVLSIAALLALSIPPSVSLADSAVSVTPLSVTSVSTVNSMDGTSTGTFTIKFEVVANTDDLYIPKTIGTGSAGTQYTVTEQGRTFTGTPSASLVSTADMHATEFTVHAGQTKDFTATVNVTPDQSGFYSVGLTGISYATTSGGALTTLPLTDGGFITPQLYLVAPCPTPAVTNPTISSVTIASNNTHSAYAKANDVVSVAFASSDPIDVTSSCNVFGTIGGHAASFMQTSSGNWTATTTMLTGDIEGTVPFSLTVDGTVLTGTTNGSTVTYDQTRPGQPSSLSIFSATDSGISQYDGITNVETLSLLGYADDNARTVLIYDGATVVATTTPVYFNGHNQWSTSVTLSEGVHSYTATDLDLAGNESVHSGAFILTEDRTAPSITVTGGANVNANAGQTYIDQGASAADSLDGAVSVTTSGVSGVNVNISGTYQVTYTATDAAGNVAHATRTVTVGDFSAPVFGAYSDVTLEATSATSTIATYSLPSAADTLDGAVTPVCAPQSSSLFTLGNTVVTCTATDASGNTATTTFTMRVVDTTAPTITLVGSNTVSIAYLQAFADPGTTASDIVDGSTIVTTSGTVDNRTPGTYLITYTSTDAHANTASTTREVMVRPIPSPTQDDNTTGGGGSSGGGGGGGGIRGVSGSTIATTTLSVLPTNGSVLGASTYNFTTDLQVGSKGADVTALQQFLHDNGFMTDMPTGYFGTLTKAAVIKYQQSVGVRLTGNAGPLTRAKLNAGALPTSEDERKAIIMAQINLLLAQVAILQATLK